MGTEGLAEIVQEWQPNNYRYRGPEEIKTILVNCKNYLQAVIDSGEDWSPPDMNHLMDDLDELIRGVEVAVKNKEDIAIIIS